MREWFGRLGTVYGNRLSGGIRSRTNGSANRWRYCWHQQTTQAEDGKRKFGGDKFFHGGIIRILAGKMLHLGFKNGQISPECFNNMNRSGRNVAALRLEEA